MNDAPVVGGSRAYVVLRECMTALASNILVHATPLQASGRGTYPDRLPARRVAASTISALSILRLGVHVKAPYAPSYPAESTGAGVRGARHATMAEQFWPGEDPIGKRVSFVQSHQGELGMVPEWLTVVGVASNVRHYSDALGPSRALGTLTLLFGACATLLAALGIFGVLSLAVARRRQELGVRMAIGATPASLLGLVVRYGVGLAMVGSPLGLLGALAANRLIASLLFQVEPFDPLTYATVTAAMLAVAGAAALAPAARAARTDPARVLREE